MKYDKDGALIIKFGVTTKNLVVMFDGAGAGVGVGTKTFIHMPYACTIMETVVICDQAPGGTGIAIDVWKDVIANAPPTDADTITNGNEIAVGAGVTYDQDTDLSDWTTVAVAVDDVLGFNIDDNTNAEIIVLCLKIQL